MKLKSPRLSCRAQREITLSNSKMLQLCNNFGYVIPFGSNDKTEGNIWTMFINAEVSYRKVEASSYMNFTIDITLLHCHSPDCSGIL